MSTANLFGSIVTVEQVEKAVAAGLKVWISDYLGELERIEGYDPGSIQRPLDIFSASEFAKAPEDMIPCIIVISPGTESVHRHGDGKHEAIWTVAAASVVSDMDRASSRQLASTYAAAIRTALVQHKRLKSAEFPQGFGSSLSWVGERYDDIAFSETRTLASARTIFSIAVEDVVQQTQGPREPSPDPSVDPGPWPNLVPPIKVIVQPEELDEVLA